jgi:predicted molibdopterin-dependent oxidoreductase YjgC
VSLNAQTEVFAFSTHRPNNFRADRIIPIKSFYEKDGYLVNTEGRIRKFYRSVTAPERTTSLESFFATLLRSAVEPQK